MQIRTLSLDELKPAPYNPRVDLSPESDAYRRLARSLEEFSLVQPIVWNERTGHVVSGHQRLKILRDQGRAETDVVVVSLDLAREKALNVTLNNAQVAGEWDAEKLIDVVGELKELPDFDATLTGFDPPDLDDLLLIPDPDFEPEEDDEESRDVVTVTLEVPPEDWEAVRPELDRVVGEWDLVTHVKLPE